jgi:uncharacterized membrane protein YidH (DUF202 family)
MSDDTTKIDAIAINEVQLILAEKRTSLALMRTGIAVLALPLSVISFLIATSKHYHIPEVLHLIIPLGVLNLVLIVLGAFLVMRAIIRLKQYDHFINEIKRKHSVIGKFIK